MSQAGKNASLNRSHSEFEYKDLLGEFQCLQRKLERKTEALLLVSQDLAKCQTDRDSYREKAEQLQGKCIKSEGSLKRQEKELDTTVIHHNEERENMLALLTGLRRENRLLQEDNLDLRQQLKETKGDIKVLRQQLAKLQLGSAFDDLTKPTFRSSRSSESSTSKTKQHSIDLDCSTNLEVDDTVFSLTESPKRMPHSVHLSEFGLEEIEKLKQQYMQLEGDLRSVLCEKEELICEKESYQNKCDRLNEELSLILSGNEGRVVGDIDSILAENRYLKAQLENAHEETGLAKAALNKYRNIMERRKNKLATAAGTGGILGSVGSHGGYQDLSRQSSGTSEQPRSEPKNFIKRTQDKPLMTVVTPKQVEELLGQTPGSSLTGGYTDYRSLATALFDAVSDKNMALSHLRKTNKILGKRVTELEARVRSLEDSRSPIRLTQNNSSQLLSVSQHPPEPIHSSEGKRKPETPELVGSNQGESPAGNFTEIDLSANLEISSSSKNY